MLPADPYLIEQAAYILDTAGAALAAFESVAIVLEAPNDAHDVCADFERLQNMLGLKSASARHCKFSNRDGPAQIRHIRSGLIGGTRGSAGTRAIRANECGD